MRVLAGGAGNRTDGPGVTDPEAAGPLWLFVQLGTFQRRVDEKPGSRAHVGHVSTRRRTVQQPSAKYRCGVGALASVTAMTVTVRPDAVTIGFPPGYAGPTLDYCKAYRGRSSGDPGDTIEIGRYVRGEAHGI